MGSLKARRGLLAGLARWMRRQGYAGSSIKNYIGKLRTAEAFLAARGAKLLLLAEHEVVADYLRHWSSVSPSPSPTARQQILIAIECFLAYARRLGRIPPKLRPTHAVQLDDFAEWLRQRGYTRSSIESYLGKLRTIATFLSGRGWELTRLSEPEIVAVYLGHWQSVSAQPGDAGRRHVLHAVRCFLRYARNVGLVAPEPVAAAPPLAPPIADFIEFLRVHQGVSQDTWSRYRGLMAALADFAAARGYPALVDLPVEVLDGFVAHQRPSRHAVARAADAVRSFLRYLFLVGLEVRDRSRWVQAPRMYRNERLPRHLYPEQLKAALAGVDRDTPHGKKVWAVQSLLNTYGLRICEVARLKLDDLSLEASWLRVERTKTLSQSMYPLTPTVEEALRDYLEVRPEADHPELFLTTVAPPRPYRNPASLANVCVRPVLASVVGTTGQGAHALRHTLALRLRQGGVSVGMMRQILGHRTSQATGLYLRIDLEDLREVACNYADLLESA